MTEVERIVADENVSASDKSRRIGTLADKERVALRDCKVVERFNTLVGKLISPQERVAVQRTNDYRNSCKLHSLWIDLRLCDAARDHSRDMTRGGWFSHYSRYWSKRTPWQRANNFGTSCSGENIAGVGDGSYAVTMWIKSGRHRRNMIGNHSRMGIGGDSRNMTQMFGN